MPILIKIFGIFLFLLPLFSQQQKIEVILTVEDQEHQPNFNIIHKNQSSFEIITNESFSIKSFSMKLGIFSNIYKNFNILIHHYSRKLEIFR